jgi:hypothetical protein
MRTRFKCVWGMNWTKRAALRGTLLGVWMCCIGSGELFAQGSPSATYTARGQEEKRQAQPQQSNRGARPSPDIVTDNLEHVAAAAGQILEFLNKDAGLMVEFKRLLAQDAGAAGQIVDETDLTDAAVTDRLTDDLRARVLATRLLQRYGYLLPKVNPESDLAAEHNLVLQDRAYAIARAAEGNSESRTLPAPTQTVNCDPERFSDCDFPPGRSNRIFPSVGSDGQQNQPTEPANPGESYPGTPPRTDSTQSPRELRADLSVSDMGETVLASMPQASPEGSGNSANFGQRGGSKESENPRSSTTGEFASSAPPGLAQREDILGTRPNGSSAVRKIPSTRGEFSSAAFEPVRMVHQPNPYADAPSLYDLYV